MKLVTLTHYRCNDYDCSKIYAVNDETSEDELFEAIKRAQTEYLKLYEEKALLENKTLPLLGKSYRIEDYPDTMTIQEVKNAIEAFKEAQAEQSKLKYLSFEDILGKYGFKRLGELEDILELNVEWGHNHGKSYKY